MSGSARSACRSRPRRRPRGRTGGPRRRTYPRSWIVEMIDDACDGRPPDASSSSVLTSDASEKRGGGCVKCCSGRTSRQRQGLLGGELREPCSRRPRRRRRRAPRHTRGGCPSKIIVRPLARSRVAGRRPTRPAPRLDVDPDLVEPRPRPSAWPRSRCQISGVQRGAGPGPGRRLTRSGVRRADVGRIASCASCAFARLRLVTGAARPGQYSAPNSVLTSSAISRSAASAIVQRVGPHVGDEPDRALARQVDAFVQALGERHRLARREPELAGGFLLQGRTW